MGNAPQLEPTAQTVNVERTGTYFVTYFAQDNAANFNYEVRTICASRQGDNCDGYKDDIRTVHIVDTLKPVIALNYGTDYFQYGEATDTGITGSGAGTTHNPADENHPHRLSYMAESANTSLSGWMIGAIASAVTGLALLGYSR